MIFDSHFHMKQLFDVSPEQADFIDKNDYHGFCSCRRIEEVEFAERFIAEHPAVSGRVHISFGIHPQAPEEEELETLAELISEKRIAAVGEIGLDRFSEEFAAHFELQQRLFLEQLKMAQSAHLPVILHIRKAIPEVFELTSELKKCEKVIFHSFPGTPDEALSLLNRGINAFFSFGASLINGHKKAAQTVRSLPEERILTETDAPYQPIKGESFSKPSDILLTSAKIADIRGNLCQR